MNMKSFCKLFSFFSLLFIITLGAGSLKTYAEASEKLEASEGKIFLYGEEHGVESIIAKEFELWKDYYGGGMRHLFLEQGYSSAELLNLWMQSGDDEILDGIFENLEGTSAQSPFYKEFYKNIKEQCPETIFHGTDVEHQFSTTGRKYLEYLRTEGLTKSDKYKLATENIIQGRKFYLRGGDETDEFRENCMTENFIREFDALGGEDVMGIYGGYHTLLEDGDVMAGKLYERYGDNVTAENLAYLINNMKPLRTDSITVDGKEYGAAYFGKADMTWLEGYSFREYWRLEDAYDDFKDKPLTGNVLPYDNYPFTVEDGQAFVIDYTMTDGSVRREYFRTDGYIWQSMKTSEEFTLE